MSSLVFGPVPSRRLGRSLGINNIPPKHCSYSCVYCQVGRTPRLSVRRAEFFKPEVIIEAVLRRIREVGENNIDYATFVPDGEPTLDVWLGREIEGIGRETGVKIAVLTNSSLLWRRDVREDLMKADLVSMKIDASSPKVFHLVNRPHPSLRMQSILDGVRRFAEEYPGMIITETMLVSGLNDEHGELKGIASILASVNPSKAYIAVPTRPPAENWVKPPGEDKIVEAYEVFREILGNRVELLTGYEGAGFHAGGIDEVEAIINVHPIRLDYLEKLALERRLNYEDVVRELIRRGARIVEYRGHRFIVERPR